MEYNMYKSLFNISTISNTYLYLNDSQANSLYCRLCVDPVVVDPTFVKGANANLNFRTSDVVDLLNISPHNIFLIIIKSSRGELLS